MSRHVLTREILIPRPRGEVFAFFADAANLEKLTPRFLNFRILTPQPIAMHTGALIDYRIALFGVPMKWRTRIEAWSPEREFVDTQISGPYRYWHHTHTLEDAPGGQTKMRDRVVYEVPFGPFGSIARALFVRGTLETIFDYRSREIAKIFPG
jgi:hypothetical protein